MFRVIMPLPHIDPASAVTFREVMKAQALASMKDTASRGSDVHPWLKKKLGVEDVSSGGVIKINIVQSDNRFWYIEANKGKMPPIGTKKNPVGLGVWAKANHVPAYPVARALLKLGKQYKGKFGAVWAQSEPQTLGSLEVAMYSFLNSTVFGGKA